MLYIILALLGLIWLNGRRIGYVTYIKRILVALDQFLNVLIFGGYEDETLSSNVYRLHRDNRYWYSKIPMPIIDALMFFDSGYLHRDFNGNLYVCSEKLNSIRKAGHCEKSFYSELFRFDLHKSMRY